MHVLNLTPEPPLVPERLGGMVRQRHLLNRLLELGHQVTVVTCVSPEDEARLDVWREAGARVVAVPRTARRGPALLSGAQRRPGHLLRVARDPWTPWKLGFLWALMRRAALDEVRAGRPDAILVQHDVAAGWSIDLPAEVPVILDCHNVTWSAVRSRGSVAGPIRRALLETEARRLRAHARRHLPRHAAVVAVSAEERVRLESITTAPCFVIPNGVMTEDEVQPAPSPGPETILFVGTMSHPPNADAARWLAEEVWPLVRRARPGARLLLVGRDPQRPVQRLGRLPGVEVTGAVESMRPWYAKAHVVAVPVRTGGGTRIKALEAFAAGRAVVATAFGVEGISGLEAGRHLLVADRPGEFASAIEALLADPRRRDAMGSQAREFVKAAYDWRACGDALAAVIERVSAAG